MRVLIYTDGSCSVNPGPGGWAWAIENGPSESGAVKHTTNQRMELRAAERAIDRNDGLLEIATDSAYLVNLFRDRWYIKWQRNGWKNSSGEDVSNQDILVPLIAVVLKRDVQFRKVKGHSGDPMNDFVDSLAVSACRAQHGPLLHTP